MMDADMLLKVLENMSPAARENLLKTMDNQSKISIVVFDLMNRLTKLSTALKIGPWETMKIPGMLGNIVIDTIDNVTSRMVKEQKASVKDPMIAVAENILKEMDRHVSNKGQEKDSTPTRTTKSTRGKTDKNVH